MIYAGSHISSSKGYEAMGKQIQKLGGDTFAFFTRSPRGGRAKAVNLPDMERFYAMAKEAGLGPVAAHASYTLNPCAAKEELRTFTKETMSDDLARLEHIPGNYYNFHPGCHVGQGTEKGIELVADVLNTIIWPEQQTTVLLETMAGKGSEIGGRFEELREILDRLRYPGKAGICLDTCHVWDAGYDIVHKLDEVLEEFDRVIGLNRLKVIHVNDSKGERGCRKDRHARLGEGHIGREAFKRLVTHPALQGLPCILETPNDDAGWTEEIAFLKMCCN
ncbi:MAG: deoxyribonuclease IV [Lachnospiraceae bacterium]|jgi:deoxyribonuclease-4|nr:deoxyribonuclease IV [Lachnospiraceae bacterium]